MRRFYIKAVAFVLGLAAIGVALGPVDSFVDIRVVGPKLEHLRAHGDDYNVLFVGSSYVHRDFAPETFDAEMARRGLAVRSFNMGVPGMDPPETYFVVREALAERPTGLVCVLIELDYYRTVIRERDLHTRRNDYWHDGYYTAQAIRSLLEQPVDAGLKAKSAARHIEAFGRNSLHAGRGLLYVLTATGRMPDEQDRILALGPAGDGFTALDDANTRLAELRSELFTGLEIDVFAEKVEALKAGATRETTGVRTPTRAQVEALAEIVRIIRGAGAHPVLVVPPCLDARAELIALARDTIDADVLVFNDPNRFPALYATENRFDVGHLNKSGAVAFSKSLAEALAPILASGDEKRI
jgi:hypothetical protein